MAEPSAPFNLEDKGIKALEADRSHTSTSSTTQEGVYHHELGKCLDALEFHPCPDGLFFLEVGFQKGNHEPIVAFGQIRDCDISTFFQRKNPDMNTSVLRVLFSSTQETKSPSRGLVALERPTFVHLTNIFGLPFSYVEAVADQAGVFSRTHPANEETRFVYIIKPPPATLTYVEATSSYDARTGLSYGHVSCNVPGVVDYILQRLRLSASQACHPLLLLTIYLEWQGKTTNQERTHLDGLLLNIEHRTGHTIFYGEDGLPTGNQSDRIDSSLFRTLSVDLAHLSYNISMVNVFNSSVQMMCNTALDKYFDELEESAIPSQEDRMCAAAKDLKQRIEIVQSICSNNTIRLAAYDKRIQLQMGVVHNLIAQEDNMRNIELARDSKVIATASKRDSSIMKILAVLGTLFLPASFIATLFSMPLLTWDGNNNHTVKSQFWVYLSVTIPLTVVVMGLSLLWIWWSQRNGKEDRK